MGSPRLVTRLFHPLLSHKNLLRDLVHIVRGLHPPYLEEGGEAVPELQPADPRDPRGNA